jgi:hypothetical protein
MIDLNDYYSGGYFLLRADKPDWPQLKTDLLPEKLVSMSRCMCPRLSVHWGWNPGNREAALKFGIPETKLDEFVEWCNSGYQTDLDVMSMFYSPEAARRFIKQFSLNTNNLWLVGTGLPKELEEANWREEIDQNERVEGVEKRIEQHLPIESNGIILGFEVVSYQYHDLSHSWLCNYLQQDMFDLYGIRPNQYGLIDSHDEANKVYNWIAEDDMKGTRAEPEPYDFWLLISYPLEGI